MSQAFDGSREHLFQLMADHATEGLDAPAMRVMSDLLVDHPECQPVGFELAAAAAHLAMMPAEALTLPGKLRDRLLTDAGRHFAAFSGRAAGAPDRAIRNDEPVLSLRDGRWGWAHFLAAASLLVAVVGWWQVVRLTRSAPEPVTMQYAGFIRETADIVRIPWVGQVSDYRSVTGEAVWSPSRQKGYMRFAGLTPNDRSKAQYQLWIVDSTRDKHPIDGGVFDVGTLGEVIVPIDPKLAVDHPAAFAVTLEKPGGVVVSDGPLLVVGTVPG